MIHAEPHFHEDKENDFNGSQYKKKGEEEAILHAGSLQSITNKT
jgi:hypothetical protein